MFLRSTLVFSFFTFLSRILGFIRDLLMANYLGLGMFADAFTVAFKLPNFFRNIFAEGAFSAAFVPMFNGILSSEGKEEALKFAGRILQLLSFSLIGFIALFEIYMPFVVMGLAPGFEKYNYKMNLTIYLTTITTPYLLFVSLVTFYSSILNSFGKFISMAFSPIILNIVMILSMYFIGQGEEVKAKAAAWSIFFGGLIQLLFILRTIHERKLWPKILPFNLDISVKKFFKKLIPAVLSSSVIQINLWIGTIIATLIPGAAAALYYVDRLVQLPVSLIGVSIAVVILPSLSRSFKIMDTKTGISLQNRAIELSLLLSLPCTLILIGLARPIISILFERGEFTSLDTMNTTPALIWLALGIPAYVVNKILVPTFFAREDTSTPFKISLLCLLLNTSGNFILIRYMGYTGIALATTLTGWFNVSMLFFFSRKKNFFMVDSMLIAKVVKILISASVMYIFILIASRTLAANLIAKNESTYFSLFGIMIFSSIIYTGILYFTKIYSVKEIKEIF